MGSRQYRAKPSIIEGRCNDYRKAAVAEPSRVEYRCNSDIPSARRNEDGDSTVGAKR